MTGMIVTSTLLLMQAVWAVRCLLRRELPELPGELGCVWAYGPPPPAFSLTGMALAATGAVYCLLTGNGLMAYVAAVVALAFTCMLTQSALPFLCFNEEGFVYRTAFGRVHACRWHEVLGVGHAARAGDWLATAQGCVCLDLRTAHGRDFLSQAVQRSLGGKGKLPDTVRTPSGGTLRLTTLHRGVGLAITSAVLTAALLGGLLYPGTLEPMPLFAVLTALALAATVAYWARVQACVRMRRMDAKG